MTDSINYDDVKELNALLVGRRIVSAEKGTRRELLGASDWNGALPAIRYELDNGTKLIAADRDGGCACSNGCFEITEGVLPQNVITNVEVAEEYAYGSQGDGQAVIRMFVYSETDKSELFHSEGGDNGYYGWGHEMFVQAVAS